MTIDVRLTVPQAIRICELIGRAEHADFRTQAVLQLDGNELRVLHNAASRLIDTLTRHAARVIASK